MPIGIYLHIPFCLSKCEYCDFCSVAGSSKRLRSRYLSALEAHMQLLSKKLDNCFVDTVFIGGGTPPVIGEGAFRSLSDSLYKYFYVADNAEFTVEVNPATVTKKLARTFVDCGVNRVSIGLQSANENELRQLGRIHTVKEFEDSYNLLRNAGIENINIDLMYGIPNQTPESFLNTLKYAVSMRPEHISAYGLQIEPGTPFYNKKDSLLLPSEDDEYSMYVYASEYLAINGYSHYEISNFARPDFQCKHNKKYWNNDPYVGIGCAAHSFIGGERYGYCDGIEEYIDCIKHKDLDAAIVDKEVIDSDVMESEYVMLRLRLADGIDKKVYKALFGIDFDTKYRERLNGYIEGGFVTDTPERCCLTIDGMYVSNTILSSILDL